MVRQSSPPRDTGWATSPTRPSTGQMEEIFGVSLWLGDAANATDLQALPAVRGLTRLPVACAYCRSRRQRLTWHALSDRNRRRLPSNRVGSEFRSTAVAGLALIKQTLLRQH